MTVPTSPLGTVPPPVLAVAALGTPQGWVRLASVPHGSWTVVEATGEIDLAVAPSMRRVLLDAHPADVVIDLSGVCFMDVSGLNVLVESWRRSGAERTRLRLVVPPGQVRRLLEITGYADLLTCVGAVDQVGA